MADERLSHIADQVAIIDAKIDEIACEIENRKPIKALRKQAASLLQQRHALAETFLAIGLAGAPEETESGDA